MFPMEGEQMKVPHSFSWVWRLTIIFFLTIQITISSLMFDSWDRTAQDVNFIHYLKDMIADCNFWWNINLLPDGWYRTSVFFRLIISLKCIHTGFVTEISFIVLSRNSCWGTVIQKLLFGDSKSGLYDPLEQFMYLRGIQNFWDKWYFRQPISSICNGQQKDLSYTTHTFLISFSSSKKVAHRK